MKSFFLTLAATVLLTGTVLSSTSDAHWRGRWWGGGWHRPYVYPAYGYGYGYPSYGYGYARPYSYGYSPYWGGGYYGGYYSPYSYNYSYGYAPGFSIWW